MGACVCECGWMFLNVFCWHWKKNKQTRQDENPRFDFLFVGVSNSTVRLTNWMTDRLIKNTDRQQIASYRLGMAMKSIAPVLHLFSSKMNCSWNSRNLDQIYFLPFHLNNNEKRSFFRISEICKALRSDSNINLRCFFQSSIFFSYTKYFQ